MTSVVAVVSERIAAREGCDVLALPPMYETIDSEALTALLESDADVTVCFEYCGYRVIVESEPLEVTVLE